MRIGRWLSLIAVAACFACFGCSTSSDWDPKAAAALKTEPADMLADIDAGDFDAMMAKMDKDPVVFDFDEKGAPVTARGMDEVRAMFDRYKALMKDQGLRFKSTLVRNDCYAVGNMGYCLVEFDQTATAGGQAVGPYKFRGTLVLRKVGNDWKWTHWHGSFREMPTMQATPADSTTAKKK
jgi:ketosteroid isomerase-like protein